MDDRWVDGVALENRQWPALSVIERRGMIRQGHARELHEGSLEWQTLLALATRLRNESR